MIPYNPKLVPNARTLRKNMTPEERHLWYDYLKKIPLTVRRQHNIENFIVDFYIAEAKLVIEVDGVQHLSPEHRKADEKRDTALSAWGITVLRYSNKRINQNFREVTEDIARKLSALTKIEKQDS